MITKIEFNDYKDHVLFEKNEITKDDGSPYKVYTHIQEMDFKNDRTRN